MASSKLSALSALTGPVQLTDSFYTVRGGQSRRLQASQMFLDDMLVKSTSGTIRRPLNTRFDEVYNILDFGAVGDNVSRPLSAGEATAYNTSYGAYGLTAVAGQENDFVALQAALYKAANTGHRVYMPRGVYRMGHSTLSLKWTATPITGQPQRPLVGCIYGDGHDSTELVWSNLAASQVSFELVGENNPYAVRTQLREFRIYQDATCAASSVCLRVGDCKELFSMYRVFCEGANGLLLKIASSATYAQLCSHFVECKFDANTAYQWTDSGGSFFAVFPESSGAFWDNVMFDSCEFGGLVYCRASIALFVSCQFYSSAKRASIYDGCLYAPLGRISVRDCYFEDYLVAVLLTNGISDLRGATIEGCHFGGTRNDVTAPLPKYGIQVIGFGVNKLGMISICDNTFNYAAYSPGVNGHHQGETGFEGVDIYAPGTRLFNYNNVNVYDTYAPVKLEVTGCYLFSFDASDDATTGQGRATMYKAKVIDLMDAGAVNVRRKLLGATAADYWGTSVSNAANSDSHTIGWSSTAYTTGGALSWLGNDMCFEYMPFSATKRMGFGTLPLYYEWTYAMCTIPYGLRINRGKDINTVANVPHWITYTLTAAQVAALGASLTGNVIIVGLPAGTKVHSVVMKITTAFAGPATLTCSVGIVGTLAKYAPALNIKQAANTFQNSDILGIESFAAGVNLVAALTSTVNNLSTTTAGGLNISVLLSAPEA